MEKSSFLNQKKKIKLFYIALSLLILWKTSEVCAEDSSPSSKFIRILVLEGGGIRGILSAKILEEIEKRTHRPINELFDVMAGSSTGSIQVAILNKPQNNTNKPTYTAKDVLDFYLTDGAKVLTPSLWRKIWTFNGILAPLLTHTDLDISLQKLLGETRLNQSLKPILIPTYDLNTADIFLFDSTNANQGEKRLKDIVLASTSVPNIYPPFPWDFAEGKHYLIDAGFIDNNPEIFSLIYTQQLYPNTPKLILSLGTGYVSSHPDPEAWKGGLIDAFGNWMKIIFLGNDHKLNQLMEELKRQKGFGLTYYFRFNPLLPQNVGEFLDASPQNIELLINTADKYISEHSEEIDDLNKLLQSDDQKSEEVH